MDSIGYGNDGNRSMVRAQKVETRVIKSGGRTAPLPLEVLCLGVRERMSPCTKLKFFSDMELQAGIEHASVGEQYTPWLIQNLRSLMARHTLGQDCAVTVI